MDSQPRPISVKDLPVRVIEPKKGWQLVDWKEVIEYKDLLYFMVRREIAVLYHQTVLGFAWAIINPFFSMVVFSVVFGKLAEVPSDGIPYPIFSYTALLPWTYFAATFTSATNSLIQGTALFTKVYFPRVFIPLTPVFSKLVDFAIAFLMLIGMMIWYGVAPTPGLLFIPPLVLLMMLTAAGLGMWLSALALQFRDIRHATGFLVQIMLYATPVVWPLSLIPHEYRLLYALYPMAGVIEGFRSAILAVNPMPWDVLIVGSASALFIFIFGVLYFRRTERIFADVA